MLPVCSFRGSGYGKYIGKERYECNKDSMANGYAFRGTGTGDRVVPGSGSSFGYGESVRRFSVKVLPDSVVTRFDSERQTRDASLPASRDLIGIMEMFIPGMLNGGSWNYKII